MNTRIDNLSLGGLFEAIDHQIDIAAFQIYRPFYICLVHANAKHDFNKSAS